MKKLTFLILFLLPVFLYAQKAVMIDSLENILNTQELIPSRQLDIYDTLCRLSINYDQERLMMYSEKGLSLAEKQNDKFMSIGFNENYAIAYEIKASYDTSLMYYARALDMALDLKDRGQEGSIYEGMAVVYWQQKKYTLTSEYFLKALSAFESVEDRKRSISVFANLGSLHRALKNYDKAIDYLNKSKILAEELEDKISVLLNDYNLANIYMDKKEYDKARECAMGVLELSRAYNSLYVEMIILQTLSNICTYGYGDYDKALEYLNESIRVGNEFGGQTISYYSLCLLADIYRGKKQWKESEEAAVKAFEVDSANIDGSFNVLANIIVSNIHLGNKDKAESFFWKYTEMKDEYIEKNYQETVLEMETKYETEKKEMRIAALEEEQKLYTGLGIVAVAALLLGIGLLFYRHRASVQKQKIAEQQIKQLEQEKDLIAARSALDAEKAEREIIARDLHDGVGAMLAVVKNNMNIMKSYSVIENQEIDYFNKALDGLDKSIVELRRVAHHIMPATLIDKGLPTALDDFCRSIPEAKFHYTGPEHRLAPEKELVLYRCAYELVGNALRHAGASNIDVYLNMDENTVYLSVVDNGCGFDTQTTPMGMGINNLRTRLAAFGGRIEIYSTPENGTEVNVELDI